MKKIVCIVLCFCTLCTAPSFTAHAAGSSQHIKAGIEGFIYTMLHKKELTASSFTGEISEETWSAGDEYSLAGTSTVIKDKGKDFVILNITDVHLSDYGERVWMGRLAIATIKRLVRRVKPDMITVTDDFVCSDSSAYSISLFTRVMDSFGVPWAPVFGNHDGEGNCDLNYLADRMLESKNCLFRKGPAQLGVGNYAVNIAEKGENGEMNVVHSLIMMDTHRSHLLENQVEWYKWAARGICRQQGHEVESSVMFHIPCVEYQYAYDEAWDSENGCWRNGYDAFGELNEKICCHRDENGVPVNNGFFEAAKQTGTTKNIICGHEHMNNFSILYQGIRLTYTLKVGMGSGFQPGFNGGSVITLSEGGLKIEHIYSL